MACETTLTNIQKELSANPTCRLIIITCMDARIDVYKIFELQPGQAHVIRNAGGNAKDALRSVIISQHLLRTDRIYVMKHTECGMEGLANKTVSDEVFKNTGHSTGDMDFQGFANVQKAVEDDVNFLRENKFLITCSVDGGIYDVATRTKRDVFQSGPITSGVGGEVV